MTVIKPKPLPKNGTIGIIAPASPQRDESRLVRGITYLEKLGYSVVLGEHVFEQHNGYLAGTDEQRASDVNLMFADKRIDAIFCARGGVGSARILDFLHYPSIRKNPKVFVGFSDVTALQMALLAKTGLVTFSGALPSVDMADEFDSMSEESFWRAVSSTAPIGPLASSLKLSTIQSGEATGRLLGGNLSVFNTLIGTPFMPNMKKNILVVEDIGEETYRLDRLFNHLRQCGALAEISGLVTGNWSQDSRPSGSTPSRDIDDLLVEYATHVAGPVLSNLAYGHTPAKLTLPMGIQVKLSSRGSGMRFLESACER